MKSICTLARKRLFSLTTHLEHLRGCTQEEAAIAGYQQTSVGQPAKLFKSSIRQL